MREFRDDPLNQGVAVLNPSTQEIRQENQEFKVILSNILSSRPAIGYRRPCLKNKTKQLLSTEPPFLHERNEVKREALILYVSPCFGLRH